MTVRIRNISTSVLIITVIALVAWLGIIQSTRNAQAISRATFRNSDLLRFHVLANSDSVTDQTVKRMVRDAVLAGAESLLDGASNAGEARKLATANLGKFEAIANGTLARAGAVYRAKAVVQDWEFPIKRYGDLTLPAGKYPAVRILLGKAQGQNWWCVLFPPLCFKDFDSGFAISQTQQVSAKESLSQSLTRRAVSIPAKAKVQKVRPKFRFALRAFEHPKAGNGGYLVMGKNDAARKGRRQ